MKKLTHLFSVTPLVLFITVTSWCGQPPTLYPNKTTGTSIPSDTAYYNDVTTTAKHLTLHSLYGTFTLSDPVLIDLINSPIMQRLKKIRQYGTLYYAIKEENYTRYDHSLGVLALLIRFNAPLNEQIAGLLHDASHSAFSHAGGLAFNDDEQTARSSYQDDHHLEFLAHQGILPFIEKHHLALSVLDTKNPAYTALEQELDGPCGLCADRIEYNLQGALREDMISKEEISAVLNDLRFENNLWFFTSQESAKKFARITLHLPLRIWASAHILFADHCLAQALKRALKINAVTKEMILFSTDDAVWQKMTQNPDTELQSIIRSLITTRTNLVIDSSNYNLFLSSKFRGVDPLVLVGNKHIRLSSIDADFAQEFQSIRTHMARGYCIHYYA